MSPVNENVKTGSLRSASSASMKVKGFVSFENQIKQHYKKIGFLVGPSLATNVIFGTEFTKKYFV